MDDQNLNPIPATPIASVEPVMSTPMPTMPEPLPVAPVEPMAPVAPTAPIVSETPTNLPPLVDPMAGAPTDGGK